MPVSDTQPEFLTTHEVAALLRVKERKVYDLASAGDIPCRRVTGKLLFPRVEIEAWISGGATTSSVPFPSKLPPSLVAGSHDPLLDWALRESASGLATLYDGSLDGLDRIFAGEAVASGLHIFEPGSGNWNVDHVSELMGGSPYVLIEFAKRQQGLIVTPKAVGAIKSIKDLKGRTIIHRQPTAGARLLFEHLLADAGLDHHTVTAISAIARTEADAAEIVASGKADATLGIEAMALQYHLGFIPLIEERFDLLVNRRACFEAPLQALFAFCRTTTFADKAKSMGGYNLATHGNVHWNGG
jgi:putative molybdopterin biosynthesis protein